jgi:hypothetical protein
MIILWHHRLYCNINACIVLQAIPSCLQHIQTLLHQSSRPHRSVRISGPWQWSRVIPSPSVLHCPLHLVHPVHNPSIITSFEPHRNKGSDHAVVPDARVAVDTHTIFASLTYITMEKVFHGSAAETSLSDGHLWLAVYEMVSW